MNKTEKTPRNTAGQNECFIEINKFIQGSENN